MSFRSLLARARRGSRLLALIPVMLLGGCILAQHLISLGPLAFAAFFGGEGQSVEALAIFAGFVTGQPTASAPGARTATAGDEPDQVLYAVEPQTGRVLFRREGSPRWEPLGPSGSELRMPVEVIYGSPDGRTLLLGGSGGIFVGDPLTGTMVEGKGTLGSLVLEISCSDARPADCWASGYKAGSFAPLFMRSSDAGRSWSPGGAGLGGSSDYVYTLFSPAAGVVLASAGQEIFRSADAGATFTKASGLQQYPTPVGYAMQGSVLYTATGYGVSRSLDGGGSWSDTASSPPTQGLGASGIAARGSFLFVSMKDEGTPGAGGVYRSSDGGGSWTRVTSGLPRAQVSVLRASRRGLYAGTGAGVFRSTDDGSSWTPYREGLIFSDTRALVEKDGRLYQGTYGAANGVFRSLDGGRTWQPGGEALEGQRVLSLAVGDDALVAGTDPRSLPSSGLFRSTDGGASWAPANIGVPVANEYLTFNALAASGRTFFAAGRGDGRILYRSTDSGASWTSIAGTMAQPSGKALYAVAIVPAGSGRVIVAAGDDGVARSTDDGATWSSFVGVSGPGPVNALALSGSTLFAGVSSDQGLTSGVFTSTDQGATWKSYGSGYPHASATRIVSALAFQGSKVFFGGTDGVYGSTDGGATWIDQHSPLGWASSMAPLGDGLWVGVRSGGVTRLDLSRKSSRLVPIVLDVTSGSAHYTTELSLVNRGTSAVPATLRYTASLGSGSGTVSLTVAAGQQLVLDDVIATLRERGLAIPLEGAQAGTLLVTFEGVSDASTVAVTARTASATEAPQPVGRAGLAYSALSDDQMSTSALTVYGLRANASDRSNLAVFSGSDQPVTLRVTAWSGSGDGRKVVVAEAETLPPYGWKQYSGILDRASLTTGWVTIERVSASGSFSAYGVVNDNGTNDGSYVLPVGTVLPLSYLKVPVLVETSTFRSELVLANKGPVAAALVLTYLESLSPAGGAGGKVTVHLAPGEQRILPEAIDFLRTSGAALGAMGGSYVGALHIGVTGVPASDVFVGARTAARSPSAGQFGLFTPPLYPGDEAGFQAFVYGLRADAGNRSNVAVVNAGTGTAEAITVEVEAFDGEAGGVKKGGTWSVRLAPGEWKQESNFLGSRGIRSGWVRARRVSGAAGWAVYGVVNDGGEPNQRTDDGAYVPMIK